LSWVALDGALVEREKATVSVYDRGFLYGDSVFETLRTYRGRLFRLESHVSRLARSAAIVRMRLPVEGAALVEECQRLVDVVRRSEIDRGAAPPELSIRVLVSRGESELGLVPRGEARARRVTYLERLVPPPASLYERGARVLLVETHRPSDAARGAKVGNYLESLLCLMRARDAGADEALVVAGDGAVVEGATSNVFSVRDGALTTPPEDAGLLPGITRAFVLELAAEAGLSVAERRLTAEDLMTADEAFLTSTLREIAPIGGVMAGERSRELRPGPVTALLRERFSRAVDG
jgi:branched-chain amino acid aminotransferase